VSIVPYSVNYKHGGTVQFLLGREGGQWRESDKWSGFGGRLEFGEKPEAGAARETYEETCGVIDLLPKLQQRLENREYRLRVLLNYKKTQSIYYFIQVPYADYPTMFRNTKTFVQYTKGNIGCIEKNILQWFSYEELRGFIMKSSMRPRAFGRVPFFRHKFADVMRLVFADADCPYVLLSRVGLPKQLEACVMVENFEDTPVNHNDEHPNRFCINDCERQETVSGSGSENGCSGGS
jgi:ADP-ribose pyrophosphatase YjhB (NUDIX family)